ncbi:MAG: PilT/PilU family type 4a pilus ATPase [Deltaproteobacteria bacterium]|nr:PilT/PilU family type 4a pilus ATPase [Deltaproteobacteria bacterium]
MARLDDLLRQLKTRGGSDLHLAAGRVPRMRQSGHLNPLEGQGVQSDEQLRGLLQELAPPDSWATYEAQSDADFAYGLEGVARFRANYFAQEHGVAAVFRIIPEKILTLEDLKMPPVVESLAHLRQGLVLVTGPTGSGKSTTLAAIIDRINTTYAKHIVTIEDPIEFVHPPKNCTFSQREVGRHTASFAGALRAAIRQNPDIILVGEMRDRETIGLAITAAEMGVLVFGTLHTNSAAKTIDRLIDAFPASEQEQIRISLSESMAGIVSQLLLRTADGKGRCAVNEILLRTSGLPNIIREGNTPMLASVIQGGRGVGMQSMDDALFDVASRGVVLAREAQGKAMDKPRFDKLVAKEEAPPA